MNRDTRADRARGDPADAEPAVRVRCTADGACPLCGLSPLALTLDMEWQCPRGHLLTWGQVREQQRRRPEEN